MPDSRLAEFHAATVLRTFEETSDCRSFELDVAAAGGAFKSAQPGQFVTIRAAVAGCLQARTYSLSSVAALGQPPRFTVKRLPGGVFSNWCHESLRVGARLEASAPAGRFLVRNPERPAVFFAAGSGITPIFAMIAWLLERHTAPVVLVQVDRDPQSAIFRPALLRLAAAHGARFQRTELFGRDAPGFDEAAKSALDSGKSAEIYICGPAGFQQRIERICAVCGIDEDRISTEAFTPAAPPSAIEAPPAGRGAVASRISATLGGRAYSFACRPDETLLAAALAANVPVPFSCREGQCTACMVRLIAGAVDATPSAALSRRDRAKGYVLACMSRPAEPELVLNYDF